MQAGEVDRVLASRPPRRLCNWPRLTKAVVRAQVRARTAARDVAVPLIAMANAEGGYVAVGIHDGAIDG